jgi:hypothetical protein
MLVLGGAEDNSISPDLFSLNLSTWHWSYESQFLVEGRPMKMCGHACEYKNGRVLVYGGMDGEAGVIYSQLFIREDGKWWRVPENYQPRMCFGMKTVREYLVMAGGCDMTTAKGPVRVDVLHIPTCLSSKEILD